jgi:insecticidal toxin complex protein TccC
LPAKAISLTPTCYFLQYRSGEKRLSLASTIAKDRHAVNVRHDTATPTLSVMDPRSLAIRSVGYCRQPDKPVIESRIIRQIFDAAGRLMQSWDPRLWGMAPKPNLAILHSLNGQPLLTDSVDAGWQLSLLDQTGSIRSFWDGRGSQRHTDYDDQQRPITVTEQAAGELSRVVERLTYGGSTPAFAEHNQCGRLIRHDDPAGTQVVSDYGLAGAVLNEARRFLVELETPDWPIEIDARDALLEEQSFITRHAFNPTGELQRQTDAMGNVRSFGYDVAGKLREACLQSAGDGQQPQRLISDIQYNAHDQIESETAGNGVVSRTDYSADDGRLIRLMAAVGSQKLLQDLNYRYDSVGNIVELEDQTQAVSFFNNQRIYPINRYRYDSLYQLVEAMGWEVSTPSHGPALPALLPTPLDPTQRRNYTQRFDYDPAGNLITRHHSDAPGLSMFTSASSNRSLAQRADGSLPGEPETASGFDACGNQLELQRGQAMLWDIRNQLSRVTLVKRDGEPDDYECYAYDRPGHRLRKVHVSQTHRRTLRTEVRYLPGLEIHRQADGEEHHVISLEAGRGSVRALHWPAAAYYDQLRYGFGDHLGSSALELDDAAGVLTQEHYYPFGGTACWAGESALVTKYKTVRYSGKERDATGLYYYGYRYYAPWLQRWINPDPLKVFDGLNVYAFVNSNPVTYVDKEGLLGEHIAALHLDINIDQILRADEYSGYPDLNSFNQNTSVNTETLDARQGVLWGDQEQDLGSAWGFYAPTPTRSYHDPGIYERFTKLRLQAGTGPIIVTTMFEHIQDPMNPYKITSKHWNGVDEFSNVFLPEAWKLQSNFKVSKTKDHFASQVVSHQYELVSRKMGFYGVLPSVVENQFVMNKQTLDATAELQTLSPEMSYVFLNMTPIGKGTQIALKEFGMEAQWVHRQTDPIFHPTVAHFAVGVSPRREVAA